MSAITFPVRNFYIPMEYQVLIFFVCLFCDKWS